MYDFGVDVVVQICVGWQIFVEICYLVVVVECDYVFFDDVFELVVSFRIGQIDYVVIEFVKFDQIVVVCGVFCQVVVFCCFGVEVFIIGDVWVDIREELDVFFFLLFDMVIQLWIVVVILFLVLYYVFVERGYMNVGLVLCLNIVYFYVCVVYGIQFLLVNFCIVLNVQCDVVINLVWQFWLVV